MPLAKRKNNSGLSESFSGFNYITTRWNPKAHPGMWQQPFRGIPGGAVLRRMRFLKTRLMHTSNVREPRRGRSALPVELRNGCVYENSRLSRVVGRNLQEMGHFVAAEDLFSIFIIVLGLDAKIVRLYHFPGNIGC